MGLKNELEAYQPLGFIFPSRKSPVFSTDTRSSSLISSLGLCSGRYLKLSFAFNYPSAPLYQALADLPCKGQRVKIRGFMVCMVSVASTQLCWCGMKTALGNMYMNGCGCVPVKLGCFILKNRQLAPAFRFVPA